MNKRFLFYCGILGLACLFVFCGDDKGTNNDDDDDDTTTVVDHTIKGTWQYTLPENSQYLPKSVHFSIVIEDSSNNTADSSFMFTATEDPDKIIYQHSGSWIISGQSLLLQGDSCLTIDKSSNLLVQAHDSTVNKTITIDTTGTYNLMWGKMLTIDHADVWRAISYNEVFIDFFLGSHLQFSKDTSTSF